MINRRLSLKDRVVIRLTTQPEKFRMSEFSRQTAAGTTFCLAGTILDESGVRLTYSPRGVAVGLKKGVAQPSQRWITYELSLSRVPMRVAEVLIAAKAREVWAAEHGDVAAELLPFYGPDWEVKTAKLDTITAKQVVDFLQVVNEIGDGVAAKIAAATN